MANKALTAKILAEEAAVGSATMQTPEPFIQAFGKQVAQAASPLFIWKQFAVAVVVAVQKLVEVLAAAAAG